MIDLNQRKLGVLLSYAAQFVHLLVNLIYTPIMLRLLGQSEYGLYQMVYSVISSLHILNFGFASAYIRYYSRLKVRDDHAGIASLNGMFITVFAVISVVTFAIGSILTFNAKQVLGDNLTIGELSTARILMMLMVVNLVLAFQTSVFDCYIVAHERFVFQKVLVLFQYVLDPLIALPLLMMGYGSVAVVSATTAITLGKLLLNIFYCIKKLKMAVSFRGFKFSLLREMGAFTFFIFLGQIIDQINWSVDKFLLGRYVGTIAVAVYGLASTLNGMYMYFSSTISAVFIPKVNAIIAQEDDNRKLTDLFTKVGRIQFYVLALILIGFISLGKPFMCLWGGAEYEQSYYIALLLIGPAIIPLSQNLGIEIQRAKNKHQARAVVYFFIAIGNVGLSMLLIRKIGALGAPLGTAISLLLGNGLFMNWYYHKRIGLDIVFFWKEILLILPSLLPSCVVGAIFFFFVKTSGWGQLLLQVLILTAVYAISVYFLGFNHAEKELVYSVIKQCRKKGR